MASNNYYGNYYQPQQQSQAPQYAGYKTAPASNVPHSNRPYQTTSSAVTTQGDYMSYPNQRYTRHSANYGGQQDGTWEESNYSTSRESTSQAAEVLRNLSDPSYNSSA